MEQKDTFKTITLTRQECIYLGMYIEMTQKYRENIVKDWEELATEMNPDGTPKFKNAKSNAEFWREMEEKLKHIKEVIGF